MNKTLQAKFIKSIPLFGDTTYLNEKPHFVVIGRSNVGKSSFINTITNNSKLAKTGATPGVTKMANLFTLNNKIYLSDLPGYGFAKLSKSEREKLQQLIEWYLIKSEINFKKIFQLIDIEIGPTPHDLEINSFLQNNNFQITIIANKADKIKSSKLHSKINELKKYFPNLQIITFSSKTKLGINEVNKIIYS